MEVKKPSDLEHESQQQQLLRKKALEAALDHDVPSSSPVSLPSDGGSDEIRKETEGAGDEPKGGKPQSAEAPPVLSPTAAAAAKAAAAGVVTDLQKKLLRAERFRMPVQLSEEEKRSSRAERFGMGSPLHVQAEELKRKARAERFGLSGHSSADEEAKKKARSERFGQDPKLSNVEEEKRKARAIRFSQTTASVPSETNGKKPPALDKAKGGT